MSYRKALAAIGVVTLGWWSSGADADICDGGGNLVANCGFEAQALTPWNASGFVFPDNGNPIAGAQSATFEPTAGALAGGPGSASLTQGIGIAGSTTYRVQFDLRQDLGGLDNDMAASLGGAPIFDQLLTLDFPAPGAVYHFDQTITTAGLPVSFDIQFISSSPESDGQWSLDNVSVTPAAAAPEPASLVLLLGGLAAMPLLRRRRR